MLPRIIKNLFLFFQLYLIATCLSGCTLNPDAPPPLWDMYPYNFGFVNHGNDELSDVNLYMDMHGQETLIGFAGSLRPENDAQAWGATAATAQRPRSVPSEVVLRWKTSNGQLHSQVIMLSQIVSAPDDFRGTVWFRYDGTMWHPFAFTEAQRTWRVTHDKGAAP